MAQKNGRPTTAMGSAVETINKEYFPGEPVSLAMLRQEETFCALQARHERAWQRRNSMDPMAYMRFMETNLATLFWMMARRWAVRYRGKNYTALTFNQCGDLKGKLASAELRCNAFGGRMEMGGKFKRFIRSMV